MGLFERISRVIRSTINSSSRITKNLVRPISDDHFDLEDSRKIYRNAITSRNEYPSIQIYLNYLKERKSFQNRRITRSELFEIAEGIDLPEDIIQADLESWLKAQKRRKELKHHFQNFLIFNAFTFAINWSANGSISWALYPALAWGAGLIVLTVDIYQDEAEEATNSFSNWLKHQEINKDTQLEASTSSTQVGRGIEKEENLTNQKESNDIPQNSNHQQHYQNVTTVKQQKSIEFTAGELQQLLDNLSKKYPINSKEDKQVLIQEAIKQIQTDPTLEERINNAINAGTVEALKELVDNPIINILLATFEAWEEGMDQKGDVEEDLIDYW